MSRRFLVAALLGAATLAPGVAPASAAKTDVTVMSRNLYLGADLIPLATASDPADFETKAAGVWNTVKATDFPTRAKALAKELRNTRPDLVGIQEGVIWRRGADGVKDGTTTPATTVVYDFVKTLIAEAKALGVTYRVVVIQDEFDFEAPIAEGYDIRITQQDAILVRKGSKVKLGKTYTGRYTETFKIPTQVGLADSRRGWVAVDAKIGKKSFRFVDTHLEAYGGDIRAAQAKELVGATGPFKNRKTRSILVGDLNSDPRDETVEGAAFNAVSAAGFLDVFKKHPKTSGQNEQVNNTVSELDSHIDHILVRPKMKVLTTKVVGNKTSDMIGGLWPSDHAGVVAKIKIG